MKDIKGTGRDAATGTKKRVRVIDGTGPKDSARNAGDKIRKNIGDTVERVRSGAEDARDALWGDRGASR
jgi:hypothetical protein